MAFKSLILDIDGVLVRDKPLLNHVQTNCVKYIKNKIPTCKDPHNLNRLLFTTYGHTARGLQKMCSVDTSDFNEFVYDKQVITRLWEVLSGTEFQQEAAEIHQLTNTGWKVSLFTNSPIEWAGQVAKAISDEVYINCPDSKLFSPLKPEIEAYDFPKHHVHIFVDDQVRNLQPALKLANWHPIHFNERRCEVQKRVRKFPTIGSIWELCMFANTIDMEIKQMETE